MDYGNISWADMPIDPCQYEQSINQNDVVKDETVYISINNSVFWGYLTINVISQNITNLDKFIKKKFYIFNKNGIKKLYEYDDMYVCNDKKLYKISDNTLVETFPWDYTVKTDNPKKVNKYVKPNKYKRQVYNTKIFIYSWISLDNINEDDKLIDTFTGEEMPLPNNINELKDIKFYFITNTTKQLFKIRKGSSSYYIADDGNLYMFDSDNNLVPGVYRDILQKWIEVNRIDYI